MKTLVKMILSISALVILSGCSFNNNSVHKPGSVIHRDIFQESSVTNIPASKASVQIEFSVKNNKARIVETYIKHSDPAYTVTVNIDGQLTEITNEPVLEDLPGDFKKNPEVGTGWKYNFKKDLLLEPGKHHITIAVPLSDVIVEKDITLSAGTNKLKVIPIYNASAVRNQEHPRFNHGLNKVELFLNNQKM